MLSIHVSHTAMANETDIRDKTTYSGNTVEEIQLSNGINKNVTIRKVYVNTQFIHNLYSIVYTRYADIT